MKKYICPSCENSDFNKISFFFDGHQKLVKCKICKLIFRIRLESFNEEINYSGETLSESYKKDLLDSISFRKKYKSYILSLLKKYVASPVSILDIGCSVGSFLNVAGEIFPGTKLIGIEPSLAEVNLGKSLFANITFINTLYRKELFNHEEFDIIHHSHVIEHIVHPKDFIENNYYHLKKGGILLITYPSAKSFYFFKDYITRKNPGHIIQNQHFNYFTSSSMRNLLQNNGFDILEELYGLTYIKRESAFYKFTIDPVFKFFKIGEPYFICRKR